MQKSRVPRTLESFQGCLRAQWTLWRSGAIFRVTASSGWDCMCLVREAKLTDFLDEATAPWIWEAKRKQLITWSKIPEKHKQACWWSRIAYACRTSRSILLLKDWPNLGNPARTRLMQRQKTIFSAINQMLHQNNKPWRIILRTGAALLELIEGEEGSQGNWRKIRSSSDYVWILRRFRGLYNMWDYLLQRTGRAYVFMKNNNSLKEMSVTWNYFEYKNRNF